MLIIVMIKEDFIATQFFILLFINLNFNRTQPKILTLMTNPNPNCDS